MLGGGQVEGLCGADVCWAALEREELKGMLTSVPHLTSLRSLIKAQGGTSLSRTTAPKLCIILKVLLKYVAK